MSTLEDKIDHLRQYISSFIGGENADALIAALGQEMLNLENLSISVNNQLSISTSSGQYVDKRTSEIGITRPPEIGMEGFAFKKMAIQTNADKQITKVIGNVLDTFYGSEAVRAFMISGNAEPYALEDGMSLSIQFETGDPIVVSINDTNFLNISQATSQELSDVINRVIRQNNINGTARSFQDPDTLERFVQIFGGAIGPYSLVQITGGEIQNILEFPLIRGTQITTPDTGWQITRTVGLTHRFRFNANSQPLLDKVIAGDKVMIYGSQFQDIGIFGTFTVVNSRPQEPSPTFETGWFDIELDKDINLKPSTPNVAPPANNLPSERYFYNINQTSNDDIKFFLAKKYTPYSRSRYSLAWEPAVKKLKIYLPATTQVVQRSLIGAAHLHLLYPSNDFTGSWGSSTDNELKIRVTGEFSFEWKQEGLDNFGSGGTITIGASTYDVDYVRRENYTTRAFLKEKHNITGLASQYITNSQANILKIEQVGNTVTVTTDVPNRASVNRKLEIQGTANFNGEQDVIAVLNSTKFIFQVVPSDTITELTGKTITTESTGAFLIDDVAGVSVTEVLADSTEDTFLGPHMWDLGVSYTLTDNIVETREDITAGGIKRTMLIKGQIPSEEGLLLFGLNKEEQEGPVKYLTSQITSNTIESDLSNISQIGNSVTVVTLQPHGGIVGQSVLIQGTANFNGSYTIQSVVNGFTYTFTNPTTQTVSESGTGKSLIVIDDIVSTVILDPAYVFNYNHKLGQDVTLLSSDQAYVPNIEGTDYSFYVTGVAEARDFAESILRDIVAFGIQLEIVIVYPNDVGLGNQGGSDSYDDPPASDKIFVWGSSDPREL